MLILGVHSGYHDACAALYDDYKLVAAVAQERMTRRKIDGGRVPTESIDECLAIAGTKRSDVGALVLGRAAFPARFYSHLPFDRALEARLRRLVGKEKHKSMERECVRYGRSDSGAMFRAGDFLGALELKPGIPVRFFNHHEAHALPTLFHTDWDKALLYTADGGGDNVQYSHRIFADGKIATLFGGDEELARPMRIDSVGLAYGYATQALGFRINRHEGKTTGLAAWGAPKFYDAIAAHFRVDGAGAITSDFSDNPAMRQFLFDLFKGAKREDVAASIQRFLEEFVIKAVARLLERSGARKLGLAGGVFANVRLNQRLAEELPVDEVFVYPAMSDQGLAAGGVLKFLLERDGLETWLKRRYPLETLYYGRDFGDGIDSVLGSASGITKMPGAPVEAAAELIAKGGIVAIYTKGMEYGPRALGARSILATPSDAVINDTLNKRLERSEFMPFAPVVAEEDAETVFKLGRAKAYAARFMTITAHVQPGWKERIPAVVHVDGTARPQTIRRAWNPLYYDILKSFERRTGLPILINTSFNVHEEPIINRPEECLRALADGRIDYVATERGVYAGPTARRPAGT
ncbi:MAG TPA: carbamoyltransferase C-terminal domain-containing protein [Alphaproteobacteria bacterium]|nr:carbamoyltransferase C-terminal domain-containing protein [Alphaproteobacteria bacterium]